MSNRSKISREEKEFFHQVKEQVEEKVHAKMHREHKHGHNKVDAKKEVERKSTEEVFQSLEEPVVAAIEMGQQFFSQLKMDDPHLYAELESEFVARSEGLEKVGDLHEMVDFWKNQQVDSKVLTKVYQLGESHYLARELDKAYLYFCWLCAADAKNPQMWFVKGIIEQSMKKFGEAVTTFCQVISMDPAIINVYTQLMNCLILMGEVEAAKHVYELFSNTIDPKDYKNDALTMKNVNFIKEVLHIM